MLSRSCRWSLFLLVVALVLTLSLTTACGGATDEPTPSEPETPSEPAEEEEEEEEEEATRDGGEITVAWTRARILTFDGNISGSRFDNMWIHQIADPMVWQVDAGEYRPGLATSWEINDDMTVFRFELREGVTLHDGTPFNADLMVWTIEENLLNPDRGSWNTGQFDSMIRNEAVGEYTWEIEFSEPQGQFMARASTLTYSPQSPDALDQLGEDYDLNAVSTGPYMVDSWPDEMTLVLKRFPDWVKPEWMDDSWGPFLDKITIKLIPEQTTATIALERGEVDVVYNPPVHEVPAYRDNPDYTFAQHLAAGLPQGLNINVSKPPTEDLSLRRAMFYAVDRQEISNLVWFGVHPPAYSVLSPGSWAYWDGAEEMYPFDPAKAQSTLEEGGWAVNSDGFYEKDGQTSTVRIVSTGGEAHEIVERRWQEVGIDGRLESMSIDLTQSRYADNDYEVGRLGLSGFDPDGPLRGAFHSMNVTGGNQYNRSRVADPWIDEMLDRGALETDFNTRVEIYQELQQYIMEQALFMPLWENTYVWIQRAGLNELEFDLVGNPIFHRVFDER